MIEKAPKVDRPFVSMIYDLTDDEIINKIDD